MIQNENWDGEEFSSLLAITIPPELAGTRLDAALSTCTGQSRSAIERLLEGGMIHRKDTSGKQPTKKDKVKAGECYTLTLPEPEDYDAQPEEMPLDIVYEDEDILVVNKPQGMVVHPAPGHTTGTLVNGLLYHCGDSLSGIGGVKRPGIVHRIDRDTSGLLCVAKNDHAHGALSAQLSDHTMHREYRTLVIGGLPEEQGTIDAPIGRHPVDRKKMAVTEKNSRPAVTHFEVLNRYQGYTHLRLRLETGRTHQIRVHLSWQNHPIVGDSVYGRGKELGLNTQCLHARLLTFRHPRTGENVTVTCPLPDYFESVLKKLGSPI